MYPLRLSIEAHTEKNCDAQVYVVLVVGDGGEDLERFVVRNAAEARIILLQVRMSRLVSAVNQSNVLACTCSKQGVYDRDYGKECVALASSFRESKEAYSYCL